jgi:hypothetical protein
MVNMEEGTNWFVYRRASLYTTSSGAYWSLLRRKRKVDNTVTIVVNLLHVRHLPFTVLVALQLEPHGYYITSKGRYNTRGRGVCSQPSGIGR